MFWKIGLPWVLLMVTDLASSSEMSSHQVRRRDQDLTPTVATPMTPEASKTCPKKSSFVCHYDKTLHAYKSICVTNVAKHLKRYPKDFGGRCEDTCNNVVDDCDDGDLCSSDSTVCDVTTNFKKVCVFSFVSCTSGNSCNPSDGLCQADDQLVPCVAVIDDDSSFKHADGRDQDHLWKDFRAAYPDRPFCLLVPGPSGYVHTPKDFPKDHLVIVHYDVAQDFGDKSLAEDWAALCGLDLYTSANVPAVGLFIDNSGHKHKDMVSASRDLFYKDMKAKGIAVKEFVNSDENWILPFLTTIA
jgi:hypothetical protein